MKFVEQSGSMRHTASYGYDLLNNLTTMTETFNGEKRTTGYTYDDDNRVTSVETAAGTEYYTYDEYGRLSQIVTKKGGVEILTKTYTYQGDGNDKPTARVNTMSVTGGGYDKTYRYYYDKNDNLISVSDSTHSTSYYYDSANQLIRENNQTGNLTKDWTYDNAGNILQSREYPYDTGLVGTPEQTNTYTYGDTNWGDKLTAYNGQTITYDAIGNPLSDGTWNYTWEHGREMASMSKNSALVITQQPQDCEASLGGTATFTVSASGTGLSCRWQYSSDGKTWHNSTNSTAIYGTVQITNLTQELMSLYWRCIVTDGTGHTAVSQVARCKPAAGGLRITTQPNNVYCAIGDSASFTVAAEGNGLTYRWQYSPNGGETWHNSTNGTATSDTLYMSEVNEYLMGMAWRCEVTSGSISLCSRAVYLKRNTTLWTNTYDADGIRVSRTNRESTYNYTYLSGQLTHLTVDGHNMYFYYGADGTPMALSFNGVRYYYVTSLQGDVIAIVDQTGTVVTTYLYDAWGNHLHVTGSLSATVGRYNPLRYRGYVYDRETGLYYVSSRYYDPEIGRWINADGQVSEVGGIVLGNNMFTYCFNNPINMNDPSGNWPTWATITLGVVAAVVAVAATVVTFGAAAPAAACTITAIGMSVGASYATASAVATVAVVATTAAAATYAGDIAYSAVTGESVLLDTVFQGNTKAYNTGLALTSVATAGMLEAAVYSPGVCFVAGTPVLTESGYLSIEEISTGDMVWAENPETGEKELKAVVQTFVNETTELIYVQVGNEEIITTPEHPFYSPVNGWTAACKLRAGDILVLQNGQNVTVEQVQHQFLKTPITVYNFEVADFHTYYVGKSAVLVHNDCGPSSRGVGGKGWVGDRTWRHNVSIVDNGGTITSLNGGIPTEAQAMQLIKQSGGTALRIEGAHAFPNPHNYAHINYVTSAGAKGTIRILE